MPRRRSAPAVSPRASHLDLQLLPDQEPVRARRRRAHLRQRRGARAASAHAALPRVGGEEGVRCTSATTRASTRCRPRSCASSCRHIDDWNAAAARPPRATPSSLDGIVETPEDEDGHVYHMYCVRSPERDRLAAALTDADIGHCGLLPAAAAPAARASLPRLLGGRLPGDREGGPREPLPAALGRHRRGAAGGGRVRDQARLADRSVVGDALPGQSPPGLAARLRRGPDRRRVAAHVLPPLRQDDAGLLPAPARLAGRHARRRDQARDVRALRLLQPLVAVRLDPRHVGRRARRHRRLARSRTSFSTRSRRITRRGCRTASRRSTSCSCSRSSRARGSSRAR